MPPIVPERNTGYIKRTKLKRSVVNVLQFLSHLTVTEKRTKEIYTTFHQ